jgi:hypothetical protein
MLAAMLGARVMKSYIPKYLDRWTRPDHYVGAEWYDYFGSGVGQHRDSDCLERANFRAMLSALGFDDDELPSDDCPTVDDDPTRVIVQENHWAVGWVEWIAIHHTDADGLRIADEQKSRLQDYPVLDEELRSEYEDDECCKVWTNCYDPRERAAYLRDHISKPAGLFRELRSAIRGDWYEAANLLPCPSDLLC